MHTRIALVAAALTVLVAVPAAGTAASRAGPRTLVRVGAPITGFAQDGARIAWLTATSRRGRCIETLWVRSLVSGQTWKASQSSCMASDSGDLALAGRAAAWAKLVAGGHTELDAEVYSAAAGEPRPHRLWHVHIQRDPGYPDPLPTAAGAGSFLAFAVPSGIQHVVGGKARALFDFPAALDVAVGSSRVAAVRQELRPGDGCGCATAPAWVGPGRVAFLQGFNDGQADVALIDGSGANRTVLTHDGAWRNALDWSRDGSRFAYSYQRVGMGSAETIATAASDGSDGRDLGVGDRPRWSPDGTKIAFTRYDGGAAQVFVMDAAGGNVKQLTSTPSPGSGEPSWSPDGTRIVYDDGHVHRISVMDADGGNQHALGSLSGAEPDWSPDGTKLVYDGDGGLWAANADGTGAHRLTSGPDRGPRWSPDGGTIAFSSSRDDVILDDESGLELYLVDADGAHLRPVTFTHGAAWLTRGQVRTERGRLLGKLVTEGATGGVALAGRHVAVLTKILGGEGRLALFDASTGARERVIPLGVRYPVLGGANGRWVVYRRADSRLVHGLDLRTMTTRVLGNVPTYAIGLSVSGTRLAWAESLGASSRIRALTLPR